MEKVECSVCGKTRECRHSTRLTRNNETGQWETNPVCGGCRRALITSAKAEGLYIPFFSLEKSMEEASERNGKFRPFLKKFAQKSVVTE